MKYLIEYINNIIRDYNFINKSNYNLKKVINSIIILKMNYLFNNLFLNKK